MFEDVSKTMEILFILQFLQNPNIGDGNRVVAFDLIHVGGVTVVQHREWNTFNSHADAEAEERFQLALQRIKLSQIEV